MIQKLFYIREGRRRGRGAAGGAAATTSAPWEAAPTRHGAGSAGEKRGKGTGTERGTGAARSRQ